MSLGSPVTEWGLALGAVASPYPGSAVVSVCPSTRPCGICVEQDPASTETSSGAEGLEGEAGL